MSLIAQVALVLSRIGAEFKTVRGETIPFYGVTVVDGGTPAAAGPLIVDGATPFFETDTIIDGGAP